MTTDLTREAFIAWLQTFEPEDVAGYAGKGDRCPLAAFLGWDTPRHPLVLSGQYWRDYDPKHHDHGRTALPAWARSFQLSVDTRNPHWVWRVSEPEPVTAADALRLLEQEGRG